MNENEFVQAIHRKYVNVQKGKEIAAGIYRGTSQSISSFTEDTFAKFIKEILPNGYDIWVDPQIVLDNKRKQLGNSRSKILLFRPDVCIIHKESKKIVAIFEIKMDFGFYRDNFVEYVTTKNSELQKIKTDTAHCSIKNTKEISFTETLQWNFLIISNGNINEKKKKKITDFFEKHDEIKLFILTSGDHLSLNGKDNKFYPNKKAFSAINSIIKKVCKNR
jgi:hypothetical protein